MKNNRKCILCGTEYSYCGSGCRGDAGKPTWMKLYCSDNCRNIFTALNNYNFNLIDKTQAHELLAACDLSIELNAHYRGEIDAIMAVSEPIVEPKPKRSAKAKIKPIDDPIVVDEVKEEKVFEPFDGVVEE